MMTPGRERFFAFLVPVLSVLCCLLVAEVVLNFLPVATGLGSLPVSSESPVLHYEPNRNYVFSQGWNLEHVNRGHVNNAGWVNDQDYRKDDPTPLIAIVGDSFIEAQMVPYAETMQARLAKALASKFRVYSFAGSGAPLSQYLIWARHAVREYGARAVVINVVFNDFDESHIAYKVGPGFWLYAPDQNGELRLQLTEHRHGLLWWLAKHSALARYVLINLKLQAYVLELPLIRDLVLVRAAKADDRHGEDVPSDADSQRMKISYSVIDAFFRDLPAMVALPPERILFTLDGFHDPTSAAASAGSYFDRMRRAFRARGQALGYQVIDLDPFFFDRLHRTGETANFPHDLHWNATGHGVAAAAVLSSGFLERIERK
jgi:hypothetical protein